jgi:hypothetical protein
MNVTFMAHTFRPQGRLTTLMVLVCLGLQTAPCAGELQWTLEAGLGVGYDSNVAIDEIDSTVGTGDNATLATVDVSVEKLLSESSKAKLNYRYASTDYEQFEDLSRQTHLIGASFSKDLGNLNSGLHYFYVDARLDNNPFLTYQRVSPFISGFISQRWFARSAIVYADKVLEDRPGRNAVTHAGEVDAYYFWRGLRRYFNLGYIYKDEDNEADRFDYQSHAIKLRFVQRFEVFSLLSRLELTARYEDRDYSAITPRINDFRNDRRLRFQLDYEVPLNEHFSWTFYAGYSDYQSNLTSAAYDQTTVGTLVEWRL